VTRWAVLACAAWVVSPSTPAHGQPAPPAAPAPAHPPASLQAQNADQADRDARAARVALEGGQAAQAVKLADAVLTKQPLHPGAMSVKVEALLALHERTAALDAYDAWFNKVGTEEPRLLTKMAAAELEALRAEPLLEIDALAALAGGSGAAATRARTQLADFAWATPATTKSWPAIAALGRLGDRKAAARAAQAYRESTGSGRVTALDAVIAAGGAEAEPILRDALGVRDPMLQATAADGAAKLGLKSLVPALQQVVKTGEMFAPFSAAVALAQLGATGGEALLDSAATSRAMDARLKAATARKARGDKGWVDAARALLTADDPVVRYQAAALLYTTDRAAATKVLQAGTMDPNPAVRTLVADLLGREPAVPVPELRRLLRDGIPRVRLSAASALLALPAPPQ
jgi:hypothetical protein